MRLLSRRDLKTLLEWDKPPCVSLYLPTHRAGPDAQRDPLRLKNLLREAESRLVDEGLRRPEASRMLSRAAGLLEDGFFWRQQLDGLAVFVAPGLFQFYRLPLAFDELLVVGGRFHIKQLLRLFAHDGRFYLLALSQGAVRLLQGTHYAVAEVDLEGVPDSLAEALRFDEIEREVQYHTGTPPATGRADKRAAIYHGQGFGEDDKKDLIARYLQQVAHGIDEFLSGERTPLVLAGVDFVEAIYRGESHYPHVLEAAVAGNPELMSDQELHDRAWPLVEPVFRKAQREAADKYRRLIGTGHASDVLEEIVPAAHDARVETLFVSTDAQRWGRFDPDAERLEPHEEAASGDEDLLDVAASYATLNGAEVYAVPQEEMPSESPMAAIFRYVLGGV